MESSTLSNTVNQEGMLKNADEPDRLPSSLEELDRILRAVETKVFGLHERLNVVSMRENVTQSGQAIEQAVGSHIHISSLVSRVYVVDEVLRKMLSELQI